MRHPFPAAALLALLYAASGCAPPAFVPGEFIPLGEPDPAGVTGVVFLVGDGGEATVETTPLVHHLRADVEEWAGRLPGDSSVAVVFLGDNIYPVGLRDRDDEDFARDSARLHAQVWTLSGPEALADGAPGLFLAGNHDWGSMPGEEGRERLRNMERYLDHVSENGGPAVELIPSAGASGPAVVEVGDAARLVLLDTQWWLQSETLDERGEMLAGLNRALLDTGGRPVVVAAHHPYATGGPHAERGPLDPFGILGRSGAIIQDVTSEPYQDLLESMTGIFRQAGPPLVYAAGHDHSLQVIQAREPAEPEWILVSGSASKLTGVTDIPGMVWAESAPGYMRLLFRDDGSVDLYVERTPERYQKCEVPVAELAECLQDGIEAFSVGYSARIRESGDGPGA